MTTQHIYLNKLYNNFMTKKLVSKEISKFVVNARVDPVTRKIAKRYLVDWIGSVIAGSSMLPIRSIEKTISSLGGNNQSTILFKNKKTNVAHAAFINAAAAHVIEMDDLDRNSISHPGSCIIAACLAYAEYKKSTLNELLDAIIIGYEVMIRIGEELGPNHYKFWHTTGTAGTIGVSAAISRLSNANELQTLMSIGSAGTMTSGLWEFLSDGAMSKQLHPAKAAYDGILACLLSKNNFTSASQILEGEKGLFAAMSPEAKPKKILNNLSVNQKKWKITGVSFKMYASCRHTHPAVEGAIQIKKQSDFEIDDIKSIKVEIYSQALDLLEGVEANTPYAAKFNLPFCIASALINGELGPQQFTDKTIQNKRINSLAKKISFNVNKSLDKYYPKKWPSNVHLNLKNGQKISKNILYPLGDPENPVNNKQIQEKYLLLTKRNLDPRQSQILINNLLEKNKNISPNQLMSNLKRIRK